jgi:aspartate aminotransferase
LSTRLARRLQRIRPSATVSITAKALSLRDQGRDIISLSAGEPDFATPEHIKAAGIEAISSGNTKYTALDGTRQLKQAIADKLRRENGLSYDLGQILVSSGAKQSCFNACQALLDTGDEVVIPAPYWVSYPDMARLADAEPVIVHGTADQAFQITPEQLAAAINPATRIVILNSPSNPTGAVYTQGDWIAFGEVLREHRRVVILSDEIYEHIYWAEEPFTSFARACPELYDRTITVNGMSKGYAMSGWRIGYAAGPETIIKAMTTIQSQSTTNACTISQAAAWAALTGDQQCVRDMCAIFRQRHDAVHASINAIPGFVCPPAHGAFYLFPKITAAMATKGIDDDVAFCEALLESAGVAVVPGSAFGAPGHLRISFAASQAKLAAAVTRIENFMTS